MMIVIAAQGSTTPPKLDALSERHWKQWRKRRKEEDEERREEDFEDTTDISEGIFDDTGSRASEVTEEW